MPLRSASQSLNDTIRLHEFEVVASYPVNNIGFKKVRIDSAFLIPNISLDLSTVLSQYSTVFIKSYGNGSLATPSFRGTTAHHTQVEWNGITLNSPMLGQMNLSQIPVSQFDGIEILYGAAGIANTGGAFGGVINLVSTPDWNNRVDATIAQTFASFGTYSTNANAAVGSSKLQSITKANFTTSKNDFSYYNDYLGKTMDQQNAGYQQYGISEDLFYRLKDKHLFTGNFWYSWNYADIPPIQTNVGAEHTENEQDQSIRSLVEYKFVQPGWNISARSALIDQFMRYRNDSLDTRHQYYSWSNRIKLNWVSLEHWTFRPGLDFNYDWVLSDAYSERKTRTTTALFGDVLYDVSKKFRLTFVAREEMIDGALMPFIFALGTRYKPFTRLNLSLSANISRNFRYPTLNDLYWNLYGNPDLVPEKSFSAEAGVVCNNGTNSGNFFMEGELTGYFSDISNLIMWIPVEGNSYIWKPVNVNEVYARGLEAGINSRLQAGQFSFDLNSNYNYCRSTNEKVPPADTASLGKQLIYIPVNTVNVTFNTAFHKFYLSYNFIFTSRRYTSPSNESYMPGYNLSNIFVGKNFGLRNIVLTLQLDINNVFDLDYQSIANRPMPGINYGITLKGNFKGSSGR